MPAAVAVAGILYYLTGGVCGPRTAAARPVQAARGEACDAECSASLHEQVRREQSAAGSPSVVLEPKAEIAGQAQDRSGSACHRRYASDATSMKYAEAVQAISNMAPSGRGIC